MGFDVGFEWVWLWVLNRFDCGFWLCYCCCRGCGVVAGGAVGVELNFRCGEWECRGWVVDWLIFGCWRSCAVGEWIVNGRDGFVGRQWKRWRFVSVMRIGKFGGSKEIFLGGNKEKVDENGQSCEERENNNILIQWRRN